VIVENMKSLRQAFQTFDTDKDGKLSYQEFMQVLKAYDLGMSDDQMLDFTMSIDQDKSGFIELEEFEQRFQMRFESSLLNDTTKKTLKDIALKILEKKKELRSAFHDFDVNQDKKLQLSEFSAALGSLGFKWSEDELRELFSSIDVQKQGFISWEEFEKAFAASDAKSDLYTQEIIQKVCVAIHRGRYQLKHVFREMDLDGNGQLSWDEFKLALSSLNIVSLDKPLPEDTMRVIFDSIDADHSGSIDFNEFMSAFTVTDDHDRDQQQQQPPV
jgi:Ca2+-binding EF-hand superfamily protein